MAIIVGSAKYDEKGKISGGLPGDQTGKEVSTQNYYMHSKGWFLLRPVNSALAAGLAIAMREACNNNNIGYDQTNRLSVINNLKTYKTLGSIKTPCECDCSSLIRACCIQNGFDPGNFTTVNLADYLEKSGMFHKRISVDSKTEIMTGDVLVTKTKGHTVMVVDSPIKNIYSPKIILNSTAPVYIINGTYALQSNMYVRDKNGNNKSWEDLTDDGKKHAYKDSNGNPILKSGTKITCKSILNRDNAVWIECPSGYICAVDAKGKVYIK